MLHPLPNKILKFHLLHLLHHYPQLFLHLSITWSLAIKMALKTFMNLSTNHHISIAFASLLHSATELTAYKQVTPNSRWIEAMHKEYIAILLYCKLIHDHLFLNILP